MFDTAFTLSLTQFARTLSFPERLQHRAARNGLLEAWRMRSTGLDALYYDVKALSAEEVYYISDAIAAEGLIMIVPPSGGEMLTICDTVDEYLLRGGRDVHALAIAGIGGSAIGAAAFARNVADAIGEPVAAVVSGYGLGDIMYEAMGASFLFGWLGNLRNECEVIDDVVGRPHLGAYDERHALALKPHRTSLDVDTVETILADPRLSFHTLAAHSKGNLVLSQALYALKEENPDRIKQIASGARIVTFGARITMPPDFRSVVDVMGEFDWYGEINSRPMIDSDIRVPFTGHSTNTDIIGSLQVTKTLQEIIATSLPAIPEKETKALALVEHAAEAALSVTDGPEAVPAATSQAPQPADQPPKMTAAAVKPAKTPSTAPRPATRRAKSPMGK